MTKNILIFTAFAGLLLSTGTAFASQQNTPVRLPQGQLDIPIPPPTLPPIM